jgi:hypothetical protein
LQEWAKEEMLYASNQMTSEMLEAYSELVDQFKQDDSSLYVKGFEDLIQRSLEHSQFFLMATGSSLDI